MRLLAPAAWIPKRGEIPEPQLMMATGDRVEADCADAFKRMVERALEIEW
jgi:hypothetical protein